jgi:hypothetical protein
MAPLDDRALPAMASIKDKSGADIAAIVVQRELKRPDGVVLCGLRGLEGGAFVCLEEEVTYVE